MKRRAWISAIVVCATTAVFADGPPNVAEPASALPLYDAFQRFCVDTGAVPQTVEAALQAAGAKQRGPTFDSTTHVYSPPISLPTAFSSWDVSLGGHRMLVTTGTTWPSRRMPAKVAAYIHDFDSCRVVSFANENPSVAAIRKWVGVSPSLVGEVFEIYSFKVVGRARLPIKSMEDRKVAELEGRVCDLELDTDGTTPSVSLSHYLYPSSESSTK